MKSAFFFLAVLLVFGCDVTSPKDVNKSQIKNILRDIEINFREQDIDSIMSYYHPEFQHEDDNFFSEEERWQVRFIDYQDIQITDISIAFSSDEWAVASFSLTFTTVTQNYQFEEPSIENGDLSYFVKKIIVQLIKKI
jgi:hypothetical protein